MKENIPRSNRSASYTASPSHWRQNKLSATNAFKFTSLQFLLRTLLDSAFLMHFIKKNASSLATDAMAFDLPIRWRRITRGSAASRDVFLVPKISYIMRHCKFVSQGAFINGMFFSNWNKKPDEENIYHWTEFFTSWTITSEKCTRAHVQENKSMYLSIHLSIRKPFWKRVNIYIYTKNNEKRKSSFLLRYAFHRRCGSSGIAKCFY